jgi:hypothetical protein
MHAESGGGPAKMQTRWKRGQSFSHDDSVAVVMNVAGLFLLKGQLKRDNFVTVAQMASRAVPFLSEIVIDR